MFLVLVGQAVGMCRDNSYNFGACFIHVVVGKLSNFSKWQGLKFSGGLVCFK